VTTNKAGNYFVVVTNIVGSATSQVATLTVFDNGGDISPIIVTNPASKMVNIGSNVVFFVRANGDAPLNYQWWLNQTNSGSTNSLNSITDATNFSYTVNDAQAADAGGYFVVVTNLSGGATSTVATLKLFLPPTIANQPASITTNAYATVRFNVGTSGAAPLNYKWWFSGTNTVVGMANPLVLNNVTSNSVGDYFVVVSNFLGSVTSQVATLDVVYNPSLTPAQLWLLNHSGISGDGLMIAMEAGKNYRVQSTTNLQDWTDITNFLSTSTLMAFTNSLSTNADFMFYRVASP
jgi:hypothetical protein